MTQESTTLAASAAATAAMTTDGATNKKFKLLFVCVENSNRSQMSQVSQCSLEVDGWMGLGGPPI